jgi:hypothetical protein
MKMDMPVGAPKKYNPKLGLDNFFGFAQALISCPKGLEIPVLPIKKIINGTEKLIFPTGTFKGTYFSEELKYAAKLGYEIKLIRAYSFQRSNDLFHKYVDHFYEKKSNGKGPIKTIAKLFLNSLYGRFAMKKDFDFNFITNSNVLKDDVLNIFTKITPIPLSPDSVLFNFNLEPNVNLKENDPLLHELLTKHHLSLCENRIGNVAIAAAITAYARCEIDKYKRIPGLTCYYSDTDCVHLSGPLPKHMIGDKIGMMKNELVDNNYTIENDSKYNYKKGLFLRDKVYSLILHDGTEITKFSGLHRKYIPENCFNLLYDEYIKENGISMLTQMVRRNIQNLDVSLLEINKFFNFKYDKRLVLRNDKDLWIDTKPIHVTIYNQAIINFTRNIDIQQTVIDCKHEDDKHIFKGTVNQENVRNDSYKFFDGYFLNYYTPIKGPDLFTAFEELIDKAMNEGILVAGINYLITEHTQGRLVTIDSMNEFVSKEFLMDHYRDHINNILEHGISGKIINEKNKYLIDGLISIKILKDKLNNWSIEETQDRME